MKRALSLALLLTACEEYASLPEINPAQADESIHFSNDVTLEIYAFPVSTGFNCETLSANPHQLPEDAIPFAREKADQTNAGGQVAFVLERLTPNIPYAIFTRAIALSNQEIFAISCDETSIAKGKKSTALDLKLKPIPSPAFP